MRRKLNEKVWRNKKEKRGVSIIAIVVAVYKTVVLSVWSASLTKVLVNKLDEQREGRAPDVRKIA